MPIKYKWLADRLASAIDKNLQQGIYQLPTEQELCRRYHVSRQTVRKALSVLEEKDLITRRQGSGSFLTGKSESRNSQTVAVLLSDPTDYIYPRVLANLQETLTNHGFAVTTYATANQVASERQILTKLLKQPPRGLIVEGCRSALPNPNLELYRRLMQKNCPVIFLFSGYPELTEALVVKDANYEGGRLLTEALAAKGHTQIAGIFKFDDMQGPERYRGFLETAQTLALPVTDTQIAWYGSAELDALTHVHDTGFLQRIAANILPGCTAVLCYNDVLAYHLLRVLEQTPSFHGQLPELATFDHTYLSRSLRTAVLSASHEPHDLGKRAAELFLRKIKGLPVTSQEVPWTIHERVSYSSRRDTHAD